MKLKRFLAASSLFAFALNASPLLAEDKPQPPEQRPERRGPRGEEDALTPEEHEKLRAAHDKAMQDEKVKAAREKLDAASAELRKVLRPALLAQDGSLEPILDKMEKAEQERRERGPGPGRPEGRPPGPPPDEKGERPRGPMRALSPEEREKLQAAREKIKENADVKAAHAKQEEAMREFREALRTATLAADPSVEPLWKKMQERGGPEARKGDGERRRPEGGRPPGKVKPDGKRPDGNPPPPTDE